MHARRPRKLLAGSGSAGAACAAVPSHYYAAAPPRLPPLSRCSYAQHYGTADDEEGGNRAVGQQALMPTNADAKLWVVRCGEGQEREAVVCLLQKCYDLGRRGTPLLIKAVFCQDHLKVGGWGGWGGWGWDGAGAGWVQGQRPGPPWHCLSSWAEQGHDHLGSAAAEAGWSLRLPTPPPSPHPTPVHRATSTWRPSRRRTSRRRCAACA